LSSAASDGAGEIAAGAEETLVLEQPTTQHKPKPITKHLHAETVRRETPTALRVKDEIVFSGRWLVVMQLGIKNGV
jgi:hypothetical protein